MRRSRAPVVLLLLACGCGSRLVREDSPRRPWASIDLSARVGPTTGYFQTPKGGAPGSTDARRPSVEDLELHYAVGPAAEVAAGWGEHGVLWGARFVRLSGRDVLEKELRTKGETFEAGVPLDSQVSLDWYRFAYRYRLALDLDDAGRLSLEPAAGAVLWTFAYQLDGGDTTSRRAYRKVAPFVGLTTTWRPYGPLGNLDIQADLGATLPVSATPAIVSSEVTVGWRLSGDSAHGGRVYVGLGFDYLDYEDLQTVPNHIKLGIGPSLVVGLRLGF